MEGKYNQITFCRHNYDTDEEFWGDVSAQLRLLFNNEYLCCIHMEDHDVLVIDYNYSDPCMGTPMPHWLTEDEYWKTVTEDDD